MPFSPLSKDLFDIADVELATQYMFCREPKAVLYFDAPADAILNPDARLIVEAAQKLHASGKEAIIENLSAQTGFAIRDLVRWSKLVTTQMQEDWGNYAELIILAALKREAAPWFQEKAEALISVPLLDTVKFLEDARAEFAAMVTRRRNRKSAVIGHIIHEMETQAVLFADPYATGIDIMDQVLMGGPRPNEVHVLGGAFKNGKSTVGRNVMLNMEGVNRIHIAADGGNRFKHTCYYTGMLAKQFCMTEEIETTIYGYQGDCLHPNNLAIWYNNRNPSARKRQLITPIPPQIEAQILKARQKLIDWEGNGTFLLYDSSMLGFSLDNLVSFIEAEHYRHNVMVIMIDHAGKFGDKRKLRIFERYEMTAQLIVELINRLPMVALVLSQRNAEGVKKSDADAQDEQFDTSYSANLEGGKIWEQEAHSIWLSRRPKGKSELILMPKLVRENEYDVPPATMPYHAPTGLIYPRERVPVGY